MAVNDVILIGALVFALGIGLFVVHYMVNTTVTAMLSIPVINESSAASAAIQSSATISNRMDYVIFGLFIGLVLGLIITSWFIGSNPIFAAIYFLVVVLAVAGSTILSNTWETTTQMSIFGDTINNFPFTNNILLNLPVYMAVIGFLGLVVMFAKPYLLGEGGTY